ncbi:MAG: hypothetical protein ACI353_07230 [Alloprevotella sp.]
MEIDIRRHTLCENSTLSRLQLSPGIRLDLIEPPVSGLSSNADTLAYNPGRYKLFMIYPEPGEPLVPALAKTPNRERLYFLTYDYPVFTRDVHPRQIYCGRLDGTMLYPDKEAYRRFCWALAYAKYKRENIFVNIKNV